MQGRKMRVLGAAVMAFGLVAASELHAWSITDVTDYVTELPTRVKDGYRKIPFAHETIRTIHRPTEKYVLKPVKKHVTDPLLSLQGNLTPSTLSATRSSFPRASSSALTLTWENTLRIR
jgi:hypothetical protein